MYTTAVTKVVLKEGNGGESTLKGSDSDAAELCGARTLIETLSDTQQLARQGGVARSHKRIAMVLVGMGWTMESLCDFGLVKGLSGRNVLERGKGGPAGETSSGPTPDPTE